MLGCVKSHLTQQTPVKTMATEPTMRNTPKNTAREKKNESQLKEKDFIDKNSNIFCNALMKEWSSEGYGMMKGALCTAEMNGVFEVELAVLVGALVRGWTDVAAVGEASALK